MREVDYNVIGPGLLVESERNGLQRHKACWWRDIERSGLQRHRTWSVGGE